MPVDVHIIVRVIRYANDFSSYLFEELSFRAALVTRDVEYNVDSAS